MVAKKILVILVIIFFLGVFADTKEKETLRYTGRWNNRAYNSSGSLTVYISPTKGKTWNAIFEGEDGGQPFRYRVTMHVRIKGKKILARGSAIISGDSYSWSGHFNNKKLYGSFSSIQNRGDFNLYRVLPKKKK